MAEIFEFGIFLLIFLQAAKAISLDKFYPYGSANGDSYLPPYQYEPTSPELTLETPITFYGEYHNAIWVNSKGLLSFLSPMQTFLSTQFPLDYPVIAPLYSNVDTRKSGVVFYRVENANPAILNQATREVNRWFPKSALDFRATSVLLVTWDQVGYYNQGADKVNTFQVAVISNGTDSFAEFLYADNGIQWLQGQSSGNTGLPDAKAQAGFVSTDGRTYTLKGSGTDYVRNLIRWSNTDISGKWLFRIGKIGAEDNIQSTEFSQFSEESAFGQRIKSCSGSSTLCHSQATCKETANGGCCVCKNGYYGNGYNCLKEGVPLRANGKVNLDINGVRLSQVDLQSYIVVSDGRSYTALSKVPPSIGYDSQLLYPIVAIISWLFAKPIGNGKNGYQLTGGLLNQTAEIRYKESGARLNITQRYYGLDVFDQLKIEATIHGTIPSGKLSPNMMIMDYQQQFTRVSPGVFRSISSLSYKKSEDRPEEGLTLEQSIFYKEPCESNSTSMPTTYRIKTARNFNTYESKENILRFAATSKVSTLSESEDPCIEGHVKCVMNSSCIVDGDSFRCVCNTGFHNVGGSGVDSGESGCTDVNECADGTHTCDGNAICLNLLGSYTCQCRPGYRGDGYTCQETTTPCQRDPSLCSPPHSFCKDSKSYKTCECEPGFLKQFTDDKLEAFICRDINECELPEPRCDYNAVCDNTEGSYMCQCKPGFSGDGSTCDFIGDANMTRSCGEISCASGMECVEGKCVCGQGFRLLSEDQCVVDSDLITTTPPAKLPCDEAQDCSPNGACIYNETSAKYECLCIRGYHGDGYSCWLAAKHRKTLEKKCIMHKCWCPLGYTERNDFCVENDPINPDVRTDFSKASCNVASNMCHRDAQCIYDSTLPNHYQCRCNPGFEGDGIECVETGVSCSTVNNCDTHASCEMDEETGRDQCVCNRPYQGDGIHCEYVGMCISDGDCGPNEECQLSESTAQSFECRCQVDYTRIGNGTCFLPKPCPECQAYSECTYNPITTEPECSCISGYVMDENTEKCVEKEPPCNVRNNCSPYASCIYNSDSPVPAYECRCNRWFEGNGTHCESTTTCIEVPEMCHERAKCVRRGSSKPFCQCIQGFVGNGSYCSLIPRQEGEFLLLNQGIATLRVPFDPTPHNPGFPISLQHSQTAVGIAIDCVEGRVYWTDHLSGVIKSATYKGKDVREIIVSNASALEGVAIDWLDRSLYFADSGKKTIETIKLDGSDRRTIISTGLLNPRGIEVHPYKRKLIWSDWNRENPKIEWSNVDGTERSVLLEGERIVKLPNSVSIDWDTGELCYADAGVKLIACVGIESGYHRTVVSNLTYPFGLTVTKDKYYWTDWMTKKIGTAKKDGQILESMPVPPIGNGKMYGIVAVPSECP